MLKKLPSDKIKGTKNALLCALENERPKNLTCRIKLVVALVVHSLQACIIFCCIYPTVGYSGNIII